jgi:hypothetical protein
MGMFGSLFRKQEPSSKGTNGRVDLPHKGTEVQNRSQYDVYEARNRKSALEALRLVEVKEPLSYVIVETPEGNLGRDLVSIFDEASGATVELVKRTPLPRKRVSPTHCANCGYFVLPAKSDQLDIQTNIPVVHMSFFSTEDMTVRGLGFYCPSCATAWCSSCATLRGGDAICGICSGIMSIHTGSSS